MDVEKQLQNEETSLVKKEVGTIATRAESVAIVDDKTFKGAVELAGEINKVKKSVVGRKDEILKPLNAAAKSVREFWKPFETQILEAEGVVRRKVVAYQTEQEKKAEEKKQKLANRVERETMTLETASRKIEEVDTPENSVESGDTKMVMRTVKKVVIEDETLIPRPYLVPDMQLIKQAVLKEGRQVSGVKVVEEKVSSIY